MMKAWHIAWKDTIMRFRDRRGVLLMLVAPLILSAIVGAAFSQVNRETPSTDQIPIILIDADEGARGDEFLEGLRHNELVHVRDSAPNDDWDAARTAVDEGQAQAALYLPPTFSAALSGQIVGDQHATMRLYTDHGSLHGVVAQRVINQQLAAWYVPLIGQRVNTNQVQRYGDESDLLALESRLSEDNGPFAAIDLETASVIFDPLTLPEQTTGRASTFAFFVPGIAIFFLMFTMFEGARSILVEYQHGTLTRLMVMPTRTYHILLGKIGGIFLTGFLQMVVLIVASRLIFGLNWGASLIGLGLMILAIVSAVTCLGALVSAFAQTPMQAGIVGSVIALTFAVLGGSFFPVDALPGWLQWLSHLTITRWGLNGLTDLTIRGQGLTDIVPEAMVLLGFALMTFMLALWSFQRRYVR